LTFENQLSLDPINQKKMPSWCRFEPALVALLLAVFLAINFTTGTRFPVPWQDEAFFTDPAVNYATGHGFVSTVDFCGDSTPHTFFACNTPLFPYLLGNWIRVFGFSVLSTRSLNYILFSLAALVLWFATRRLKLILTPQARLLFLVLIFLGYGDGFIFRSTRYDCTGLLLLALAVLAYSLRSRPLRLFVIAAIGIAIPFAGMQLVCYSALLGAVLLAYFRGRVIRELIALAIGIPLGVAGLFALFVSHGVLQNFFAQVQLESVHRLDYIDKDPSLALLFAACVVLGIDRARTRSFRLSSPLAFAIVAGLVIPAGLLATRKFPIYYSWMAYIPLALGFAAELSHTTLAPARAARALAALAVVLACLLGFPAQLGSAAYYWKDRNTAQIDAVIRKEITSSDWVYTDYSAYFAVRKVTPYVVIPYVIPDQDKEKVTVLVVTPQAFNEYAKAIVGGNWYDTGVGITDRGRDLIPNKSFAILLQRRINFRIYRRVGSAAPASVQH
jgi:MFS family permease